MSTVESMTRRPVLTLVCLVLWGLACACGGAGEEAREPGSEAITVPVLGVDPVFPGERGGSTVSVVEVARGRPASPDEPALYVAGALTAAPDGRLYVHDPAAGAIRVFAPDGEPLATIGRPGQGPGELSELITALAVSDGRLIAVDEINGRLTFWDLDGELQETLPFPAGSDGSGRVAYTELWGLEDGGLVGLYSLPAAGRELVRLVVADGEGRPGAELARLSSRPARALVGGRPAPIPVVRPVPQAAVDRSGAIYVTAAEEYEIGAFDGDGTGRWMLRVDWPRPPLPEQEVDRALEASADMLRAMGEAPEVDASSVEDVPERLPALASIKVDGHGHLWVFPYVYWDPREPSSLPSLSPVDVYDASGERLFAGTIPSRFALHADQGAAWVAAWDDSVWGVETDPDSGEQAVVRHRLEESFE